MWECQKCGEKLEDSFDACWSCGTSRTDEASPESRVESAGELPEHQPPLEEFLPTSKSATVAKSLAIVVGLCGIACLVMSGLFVYYEVRPHAWLFFLGVLALAFLGVYLVVIAFRTFVRPTPEILRRICGVISFLLSLLLMVVGNHVGHLVVLPLVGDTWREVLLLVVGVVAYFWWGFLDRRLATFLMGEALASQETPSDQNET